MRRAIMIVVWAALVGTVPGVAQADPPERYDSAVLNVFWHTEEPVSEQTFRRVTWYVGIYTGEYDVWSDLYQSVALCERRRRGEDCREESFQIGFSNFTRPGDSFEIDGRNLEWAFLRGTYRLTSYDYEGTPQGRGQRYTIETWVTGLGDIQRTKETYTYDDGCYSSRTRIRGAWRGISATGTLNGADLGTTEDGFMSNNATWSRSREC